jgi:hypothetical protein
MIVDALEISNGTGAINPMFIKLLLITPNVKTMNNYVTQCAVLFGVRVKIPEMTMTMLPMMTTLLLMMTTLLLMMTMIMNYLDLVNVM